MRRFEFQDPSSHKFWQINLEGSSFTVTYGRIGAAGQTQTKTFPSEQKARAEHDKLVLEKLGKGYVEVGAGSGSAVASPPLPLLAYVERFRAMVEELRRNSEIRVLEFNVRPPVSDADLAAVEEHLGAELHPALRSFYRQADGLQLRWINTSREAFDPERHVASEQWLTPPDIMRDEGACPGCVNLLPLREAFLDANWEGQIWFPDAEEAKEQVEFVGARFESQQAFNRVIRPFDYFHFFRQAAFLLRPGNGSPPVLIGDDHGACWTNSLAVGFETYLETLLAQRGAVESRKAFTDSSGEEQGKPAPVRTRAYWEAHPVKLSKLLRALEDDDDC